MQCSGFLSFLPEHHARKYICHLEDWYYRYNLQLIAELLCLKSLRTVSCHKMCPAKQTGFLGTYCIPTLTINCMKVD